MVLEGSEYGTGVVVESRMATSALSRPLMYLAMFGSADFLAHLAYICISVLSITVSPMFCSLELFALAYRVPIFNEVRLAKCARSSHLHARADASAPSYFA